MAKFLTLGNLSGIFTEIKKFVNKRFEDLIGGAPEALDTLKEIAEALGNDANLASTLTTEIAKKANSTDVYLKTETYSKTEADSAFVKSADIAEVTDAEITAAANTAFGTTTA